MRTLLVSLGLLAAAAPAHAAWSPPRDLSPAAPTTPIAVGPALDAGWIEGRRTFVRVRPNGRVHRRRLPRRYDALAFDGRGRGLMVTAVGTSRRCAGRPRGVRLDVVRLDGRGRPRGRPQHLGRECRNSGLPRLAVNARGDALLAWLEAPRGWGGKRRVVVAHGSTRGRLRIVRRSGRGDAAGHAVALGPRGHALAAYRQGSRMLVTSRTPGGRFRAVEDLGATPQRAWPEVVAAVDRSGAATVAWTDQCACGEAGHTAAPNPLRASRRLSARGPFEAAQRLDPGEAIATRPQLATGGGAAILAWSNEDAEGSRLTTAGAGAQFSTPRRWSGIGALRVHAARDGTTSVAFADGGGLWVRRDGEEAERVSGTGAPVALRDAGLLFLDGGRLKLARRR